MPLELNVDLRLAQQAANGDQRALQTIFERFSSPLYGFIHHLMEGRQSEVDEVWQESLIAALRALHTFRGESSLFTWLCSIARRKVADAYRRQQREIPLSEDLPLLDTHPLPEELLVKGTVKARVMETLYSLPEDYRLALTERYLDNLSVDEIACRQKKSYKAIESMLSRARRAFQTAFGGKNDENT